MTHEASHHPPQSYDGTVTPLVLELARHAVQVHLHVPPEGRRRDTAVLMCAPFGWEDVCSYRARRAWALRLTHEGFTTARFDLPGTGDSSGTGRDPELLDAWLSSVTATADWLRRAAGASRLVALGIGMGGLPAIRALQQGAPVDDLVLWNVQARGRRLVRELRVQSALVPPPVLEPSLRAGSATGEPALELTGFLLDAPLLDALSQVDLADGLHAGRGPGRVLMLSRDGMRPDSKLIDALRECGAELTLEDGPGYGAMMADPERALTPWETIDRSSRWLVDTDRQRGPAPSAPEVSAPVLHPARKTMEFSFEGREVRERFLSISHAAGSIFAVLTEPADPQRSDLCVVFLNAGGQRRTGPNRNAVELSRRAAARGVPAARVDLPGIGDAGGRVDGRLSGSDLYDVKRTEQTLSVLAALRAEHPKRRFVLAGLCAGAYWGFHAALADASVSGAFMLNLHTFSWSDDLSDERDRRAVVGALSGDLWSRLRRGEVRRDVVARSLRTARNVPALVQARRRKQAQSASLGASFDRLRDRGVQLSFVLGDNEALHAELRIFGLAQRLADWPNVSIAYLPYEDHVLRALSSQRFIRDQFDALLDRLLASAPPAPGQLVPASAQ